MGFSSIIGLSDWDAFLQAYQSKQLIVRPDRSPGRFGGLWSAWELDALYRFTLLPESDSFRLFMRGKQVPGAAYRDRSGVSKISVIQQLWSTGVSVNFARLELFSNPVLALVRDLEASVRCPVRGHFFATPPQAQALGVHADHEDVLVLQLHGEKSWDVYSESERWSAERGEVPAAELKPPRKVVLQEGGWMFLPRGVYHEVRNVGAEPSMHVTLGFHALTWAALLSRAAEIARHSPSRLKEIVPVAVSGEGQAAQLDDHLLAFRPFIDLALQTEHYGQPVPVSATPLRTQVEGLTAETLCQWQADGVEVRAVRDRIELSAPYRSVPLGLRTEFAPVLRQMQEAGRFQPAELPLDRDSAVLLCRFLANVGCVSIPTVNQ